jgi:hypothetical protein
LLLLLTLSIAGRPVQTTPGVGEWFIAHGSAVRVVGMVMPIPAFERYTTRDPIAPNLFNRLG